MLLNIDEILFIGLFIEGFFYGLYSGMFAIYLQYQASQKDTNMKRNIVFYSICALYLLSIALFVADATLSIYQLLSKPLHSVLHICFIQATLFACCDFFAQFILIYRCWIVWGYNIHVVIIPSILAFAFLVIWVVGGTSIHLTSDFFISRTWGYFVMQSGLPLSLIVNALVTGLIVYKIFKVLRKVKATSNVQILGGTSGSKLWRTIFILIESGMALLSIQLVRLVVSFISINTHDTHATFGAFWIIASIQDMLIGITPTIILVRTSMGFSFHDEKSMEEVVTGSLRFASTTPVPDMGSIAIVDQDRRDDGIGVQGSNNIDIIEK